MLTLIDYERIKSVQQLTSWESVVDQVAFSRIVHLPIDDQDEFKSSLKRHHLIRSLHFHAQLAKISESA